MIRPPDLVIFDCDGVLVDSEPLTNLALCKNLVRYGLDIELDRAVELFVGGTMQGVMTQAKEMGADLPDDWLDEIYGEMFQSLKEQVELIPGVEAFLDQLDKAEILYAIGSNGPHAKMDITLNRTGLMDRFQGRIVSREDVPNPKPAPDVYLKAAADLGIDPSRAVVIEDSSSGAKAGKAAGMKCFGYIPDADHTNLAPVCDVVFTDMAQLPAMLGL